MSDGDLTIEKLKIVEQLQIISQNQAVMKQQVDSFRTIHEGVQRILDRHDLMILGDGSEQHVGISGRLKTLEDDMKSRNDHTKWLWSGVIASAIAHAYHFIFGK